LSLTMIILPVNVAADETFYLMTNYAAGAEAVTWSTYYGHPGTFRYDDGPRIANDSVYLEMRRISTTELFCAYNANMTAYEEWVDCPRQYHDFRYDSYNVTRYMPSEYSGVTIDKVLVVCRFPQVGVPKHTLAFRESYWDPWYYSTTFSGGSLGTINWWDVTNTITWTSDMFDSNLTAMILTEGDVGVSYYLDYVGFVVFWHYTSESGPGSEDEYGSFPVFSLGSDAIIPIMGFCGFIGMIALPAFGVLAFKNGNESRLVLFVKLTAAFTFCLSMFLLSISS